MTFLPLCCILTDNCQPWVFSGGSYSGALSAWTQAKDPGTFWAYHASSAVVQTIDDFVSNKTCDGTAH